MWESRRRVAVDSQKCRIHKNALLLKARKSERSNKSHGERSATYLKIDIPLERALLITCEIMSITQASKVPVQYLVANANKMKYGTGTQVM